MTYDDPGWRRPLLMSLVALPLVAIPFVARLWLARGGGGLLVLRSLFLSFIESVVLFLVVLLLIVPDGRGQEPWIPGILLGILGVGSLGGALWAHRRPLPGESSEAVAGAYRTAFFLQMAFTMAPALYGFVGVFLIGELWPYLVGLGLSAVGFLLVAPTRRDIARRQNELNARGSTVSLGEALTGG